MKIVVSQDSGRLAQEFKQLLQEVQLPTPSTANTDFTVAHAGLTRFEPIDFEIPNTKLSWVFITSARTIQLMAGGKRAMLQQVFLGGTHFACVGRRTEEELAKYGISLAIPSQDTARDLLDIFLSLPAQTADEASLPVWLPGSELAKPALRKGLQTAGFEVITTPVYRPRTLTELPKEYFGADLIVMTSGSAACAYAQLHAAVTDREIGRAAPVVALGEQTASDCQSVGLRVVGVAPSPDAQGVLTALKTALGSSDFSVLHQRVSMSARLQCCNTSNTKEVKK
ncbi:uroporphyrinogen-III synthase [Arcanobacterium pluranimalium]|uniref:uroporphyrinogen-III synthase n=1 Tax=Arcanobacterium pluranimalium TaxID=108028 RepID=UPI00195AE8A2|nr:uroporphyrinogen-III synthase [Arcanobacterium pluranimalium]MBM7825177.1 uroporphyrinogen-III synthase [Arcanobacterium pluranimalium]